MNSKKSGLGQSFHAALDETGADVLKYNWSDRDFYAAWLVQTYHLVRHTTRFLALAAARTEVEQRDDHYGFLHHLKEESNHDLPLLKDLKALGYDETSFPFLPEARLIRNNQYYWIDNRNPLALNGYALLLEGLSVTVAPEMIRQVIKAGYPGAVSFLTLHVNVDQDHYADGIEHMQKIASKDSQDIFENLEESALLYRRMLLQLATLTGALNKKSTAARSA